jgi:predicted transposase/invertase (TIGR01784 family)
MSDKHKKLPHDALFKRIMENDIAAKEFLNEYLPKEVKDIVDLETIKVQKESYIEPNLTKRLSDIVYSVNTKDNKDAFIYCISEHQSSVDQLMAFRLWKYTLLLAERHIDKKEKIPLIFPLVVYAGTAKYTAPRNLWSLFEYPELDKKLLTEDHALVNLQAMSDDEIAKKKHLALVEYIMKHVQMRDMLKLWESLFKKLPDAVIIDKEHGYFYISNLLWYVDGKLSVEKRDELSSLIIEHLPKDDGEKLMRTIADSYIDEGVNKGIAQGIAIGKNEGIAIGKNEGIAIGIEKIARRMLKENTDIKFITSVTGLSTDEILKLQNKM